jgi:hypothetical protein
VKPEEGKSTKGESFREGNEFLFQSIGLGYGGLGFVVFPKQTKNHRKQDKTRDDFRGFKFPSEYCAALGCNFHRNSSTEFHIYMQMRIFVPRTLFSFKFTWL